MKNYKSICSFLFALSALVTLLSASSTFADNRLLVCQNKTGKIVFEICGIRGCPATVTVGSKVTKYNLKRVKNSDGSLNYSVRAGSRPSCNIAVSRLSQGQRKATAVSCASKLTNSSCKFIIPGDSSSSTSVSSSSTSTSTSTSTSSSSSSSSASSASSDDNGSDSSSSKSKGN